MDNRSNNLYNEINMKNILSLISISSLLLVLAACGSKQAPTAEEIVAKARAVKTLNAYDEMSCVVYEMRGLPESPQTSIDRFISDDCLNTLSPAMRPEPNPYISSRVGETIAVICLSIRWDFPSG